MKLDTNFSIELVKMILEESKHHGKSIDSVVEKTHKIVDLAGL